jgi:hypothetical protein
MEDWVVGSPGARVLGGRGAGETKVSKEAEEPGD